MKKIQKWWYRWGVLAVGTVGFPLVRLAYAAFTVPSPSGISSLPTTITGTVDVQDFLCIGLDWMFWVLIVLSIAMFLVGAYRYTTSQGEPEKVHTANKTLLYAAIAVAVALIAGGMPLIIDTLFTQ